MKSVFEYSDYREFLQDFYQDQKSKNPFFSFRFMSKRAQVSSSSFFKLVMQGKRNLSKISIEKTLKVLKLEGEEADFFRRLVVRNQDRTVQGSERRHQSVEERSNHTEQNETAQNADSQKENGSGDFLSHAPQHANVVNMHSRRSA